MVAELNVVDEITDIELQLDLEEEARVLDSVGLDRDLDPITPQMPDWVEMCQQMNNEEVVN
jgi:hypothetical protein